MHVDFSDVPECFAPAIKAIEDVAVSRSHILLRGPAGIGGTMLARRIPTILPRLEQNQSEELGMVYLKAGLNHRLVDGPGPFSFSDEPPFRAPHHTVSMPGAIGGKIRGSIRLGELHLARYGVLFLDQLPEFHAAVVQGIGAKLADSHVMVVASATVCPCGAGIAGGRNLRCDCSANARASFNRRVQLYANMIGIPFSTEIGNTSLKCLKGPRCESSQAIRERLYGGRET